MNPIANVPNDIVISARDKEPAKISFYHADDLGSTGAVTDQSGAGVCDIAYYPFGTVRIESHSSARPLEVHHRFTGNERDLESTLDYFNARMYSADLGRFVSPDPYTVQTPDFIVPSARRTAGIEQPQYLHAYAYASNRVTTLVDPEGLIGHGPYMGPPQPSEPEIKIKGTEKTSSKAVSVLKRALEASQNVSATITSAARDSGAQARAMYENLETHGVEHQRKLYAAPGDNVISVYESARRNKKAPAEIIELMAKEIQSVGPSKVSNTTAL